MECRTCTILVLACCLGAASAAAQDENTARAQAAKPAAVAEVPFLGGSTLRAYPYVYYTPETDVAYGGGATYTWRDSRRGPGQRPNSILAAVTFTTRNQLILSLDPEITTSDDQWLLDGYLGYKRYPDKFWGLGADAPAAAEEEFEPLIWDLQLGAQRRVRGSFLAGPSYVFMDYRPRELEADGQLADGGVPGAEGGLSSGLGLVGTYDSRDRRFSAERGTWAQAQVRLFGTALGSDWTFQQVIIDLRRYLPLAPGRVLALQAYTHTNGGAPPFNMLAMVGGSSRLRGYWTGRYRDRKALVLQAEARFALTGRLGGVAFAGAGSVGDEFRDWQLSEMKPSLGAGLRYLFDPDANLKLRLDFGFGEAGQNGVYVTVDEAF